MAVVPRKQTQGVWKSVPKIGGSLVGVWNGWGYGIAVFVALNCQESEPEIWRKSLFLLNFRDFPGFRALQFQTLENGPSILSPIHTPSKRWPTK